jgi:hypothetical protein
VRPLMALVRGTDEGVRAAALRALSLAIADPLTLAALNRHDSHLRALVKVGCSCEVYGFWVLGSAPARSLLHAHASSASGVLRSALLILHSSEGCHVHATLARHTQSSERRDDQAAAAFLGHARQTDGRADGRTDRQTGRLTDRQIDKRHCPACLLTGIRCAARRVSSAWPRLVPGNPWKARRGVCRVSLSIYLSCARRSRRWPPACRAVCLSSCLSVLTFQAVAAGVPGGLSVNLSIVRVSFQAVAAGVPGGLSVKLSVCLS